MRAYLLFLLCCFYCSALHAGFVRVGQSWSHERYAPNLSVQEHYDLGLQEVQKKEWDLALNQFMVVTSHFQDTPFFADSVYYLGVCYYFLGHFDLADRYFTKYLDLGGIPKHFERVFDYKYLIAESYREGHKRHLLGVAGLPRVMSGKGEALKLYDEVIASLPSREIAAKALIGKAALLRKKKEYKESVEVLQTLIRRFPRHHLAAEAFLTVGEIYLQQIKIESQNPDLIALAQVNLQKFRKSFPGDDRCAQVETTIAAMQEVHAHSLFETARFYERIKRPQAAEIYYNDTIRRFPDTESARKSQEKLERIVS